MSNKNSMVLGTRHLFLYPELLSRLLFTYKEDGNYYVQANTTPPQQPKLAYPEEIIRQIFILSLIHHYKYSAEYIKTEYLVLMGRARKRADIIVMGDGDCIEVVVEVKQQIDESSIEQLKSYLWATSAIYGAVVSGHDFRCYQRVSNRIIEIDDLPLFGGISSRINSSENVLDESITSKLLQSKQKLIFDSFERITQTKVRISVKGVSLDMHNEDVAIYRKVQQKFIAAGIVIPAKYNQDDWLDFIGSEFERAAPPPIFSDLKNKNNINHLLESQLNQVIRIINDYIVLPWSLCEKYAKSPMVLHSEHIIPMSYIQRRLAAVACFRKDDIGATNAIKRAVSILIDRGNLLEISNDSMWNYGTALRSFKVIKLD